MLLTFPNQMFRKKIERTLKLLGQILSEINRPTKVYSHCRLGFKYKKHFIHAFVNLMEFGFGS